MPVTISYAISNEVNFVEVGLGVIDPLTTLPDIYGNADWSFDLSFSGADETTGDPIVITDILATVPGYVSTQYPTPNVVRLSKAAGKSVFPGEQYRLVRFETQENFVYEDVSDIEEGLSVVGWDTPSQEEVNPTYSFLISYTIPLQGTSGQTTFTLDQTLYWNFAPGWATLQQLVANSSS